jgi:protein TonB
MASTPPDAPSHEDPDDGPRLPIAVDTTGSGDHGAVAASPPPASAHEDEPLPEAAVDGKARLLRGVAPAYPAQARAEGVEGTVDLELVVDAAGSLERARVVRGVGHGLDDAALAAVRAFRFTPATKGGHPVRARIGWSIAFRFRDSDP